MRYKTPSLGKKNTKQNSEQEGNPFQKIGKPLPERVNRTGEKSLRIWENVRDELVKNHIKKNTRDQDCIPNSAWFIHNATYLTGAFRNHGGYPAVVNRLITEGYLAEDYISLTKTGAKSSTRVSKMAHLYDENNLHNYMLEVCAQLGHFPQSFREMKKTGHDEAMVLIRSKYGKLSDLKEDMREAGLLDKYPELD